MELAETLNKVSSETGLVFAEKGGKVSATLSAEQAENFAKFSAQNPRLMEKIFGNMDVSVGVKNGISELRILNASELTPADITAFTDHKNFVKSALENDAYTVNTTLAAQENAKNGLSQPYNVAALDTYDSVANIAKRTTNPKTHMYEYKNIGVDGDYGPKNFPAALTAAVNAEGAKLVQYAADHNVNLAALGMDINGDGKVSAKEAGAAIASKTLVTYTDTQGLVSILDLRDPVSIDGKLKPQEKLVAEQIYGDNNPELGGIKPTNTPSADKEFTDVVGKLAPRSR